jgi:hypothetical protein
MALNAPRCPLHLPFAQSGGQLIRDRLPAAALRGSADRSRLSRHCPAEQVDYCAIERRDVVRATTRDQSLIGDRFLIHPFCAGIAKSTSPHS